MRQDCKITPSPALSLLRSRVRASMCGQVAAHGGAMRKPGAREGARAVIVRPRHLQLLLLEAPHSRAQCLQRCNGDFTAEDTCGLGEASGGIRAQRRVAARMVCCFRGECTERCSRKAVRDDCATAFDGPVANADLGHTGSGVAACPGWRLSADRSGFAGARCARDRRDRFYGAERMRRSRTGCAPADTAGVATTREPRQSSINRP